MTKPSNRMEMLQSRAGKISLARSIAMAISIVVALTACTQPAAPAQGPAVAQPASSGIAHPESWPKTASPGFKDAETEAFVDTLLAKMSLEEKVGQMIQGDTSSVRPEDLRK